MLLEAKKICKSYQLGKRMIPVLRDVDLAVAEGEFAAIMGTSGTGKSTLLHILGGLDRPDQGAYQFYHKDMLAMDDKERSWVRAHWIGFVFQTFDLLPELDVVGNISLPFLYNSIEFERRERLVNEAVDKVGLSHRKSHRPMELSGGEMQRAAVARALAVQPKLILADEPTGNLDNKSSCDILALFQEVHSQGTAIIMVTHDKNVAARSERILTLEDGCLV